MDPVLAREREHYDRLTMTFLGPRGPRSWADGPILRVFDRLLEFLPAGDLAGRRFVEVGGNEPRYSRWLLGRGARSGLDLDLSRVALARGRTRHRDPPGAEGAPEPHLAVADAGHLPLPDRSFDGLLCLRTYHHFPDPGPFLAEAHRVLREDGLVVLADPNGDHPLRGLANRFGKAVEGGLSEDERSSGADAVADRVRRAGFRLVAIHRFHVLSEALMHVTELVTRRSWLASLPLRAALVAVFALDLALERTLVRVSPRWAWSFVLVARKERVAPSPDEGMG